MKPKNLLLFGLIFLFIASCGKKEDEVIKIGVVFSLTGAIAPYGKNAKNGLDLAIENINSDSLYEGKLVKAIYEDAESSPKSATFAVQKLVYQDNVNFVIGFIGSSLLMATAPIFNREEVILISPGASSPDITHAGKYIFRTRASGDAEAKRLAEFAVNSLGHTDISVLYINNDYGISWLESFSDKVVSLGGNLEGKESFNQDATNLRTQITKIGDSKSTCLLILGYLNEIALALRQIEEMGLKLDILTTVGIQDESIFSLTENYEGIYFATIEYQPELDSTARNFDMMYRQKYGIGSDVFAANAFDALNIIVESINASGINTNAVHDYIIKIKNFRGVSGRLSFDKNGDVIKKVIIKQIQGKNFITLEH